jgi:hypothetical protein
LFATQYQPGVFFVRREYIETSRIDTPRPERNMTKAIYAECMYCGKPHRKKSASPRCSKCKYLDPDFRKKVSDGLKQSLNNPETRKSRSEKAKRMWSDESYREKQAESYSSRKDEEYRSKQSISNSSIWSSLELRERQSKMAKERWDNPDYRSKFLETVREEEYRKRKSLSLGGDGDLSRIENDQSSALKQWSKKVKTRDNHQCQHCGSVNDLHAHHVKRKAMFPDLALEITNGITLCSLCHAQEHRKLNNQ